MPLPSGPVPSFQKGSRLLNGSDVQKLADLLGSSALNLVAVANGTRVGATKINAAYNLFGTVATGVNDSCVLPLGYAGLEIVIANAGVGVLRVFASGTDTIDQTAGATGVSIAANSTHLFKCLGVFAGAGIWVKFVGVSAAAPPAA